MLVVLSEIDCLGFLKSKGVNPDEFYRCSCNIYRLLSFQ